MKIVRYAKVRINYKSGNSVTLKMKKFKVTQRATGLEIEWEVLYSNQKPMYMSVDEIESIYQVGSGITIGF